MPIIQHLRFPFSFFLLPVYLFALSQATHVVWTDAAIIGIVLHLLIYPASNGYNSYMDQDTGSIGGLKHPPPISRQLLYVVTAMDVVAVLLVAFWINLPVALMVLGYVLVSRAYSYRGIRLKKHPWIGYATVVVFQGAWVYGLTYAGIQGETETSVPLAGMVIASLMIGGAYPLTQIYQHEQDIADNVRSLSYVLGIEGTFRFSGALFLLLGVAMLLFFSLQEKWLYCIAFMIFLLPALLYLVWWYRKARRNLQAVDYDHTMRMNTIATVCMNTFFLMLVVLEQNIHI